MTNKPVLLTKENISEEGMMKVTHIRISVPQTSLLMERNDLNMLLARTSCP
jgi:hypothetical protein